MKYNQLFKRANGKKSASYWTAYEDFVKQQNEMFNIIGTPDEIKLQEVAWKVDMSQADWQFYENQQKEIRFGYCSSFLDRKWLIAQEKRKKREVRTRNESYGNLWEVNNPIPDETVADHDATTRKPVDPDFIEPATPPKRAKYAYTKAVDDPKDPLPPEFRHIRNGLRSVRPEYYVLIEKLISVYHMSYRQAQAAVFETANHLFGRKQYGQWKQYSREQTLDCNTLPEQKNARKNSKLFETMSLSLLVEDIMANSDTVVVYSHDGSSMNKVGSYIVNSLTINGVRRALPVFGVFTESRNTLAALVTAVLDILSAASDHKYSAADILKQISFVMSDSTAHNIGVIEEVCEELEVTDIPLTLTCNVHPLMMFDRKMKELCQHIHNHVGGEKLSDCFLVSVDFHNESFIYKAVKCLSNFICKDFSAKPWNYSTHFGEFISPKENVTLSLKDCRFNRFSDCCIRLLYLIDDIAEYLEKFSDILNNVAIIDRSFVKMELLKPIFTVISLLGVHVTKPFHYLLMDKETTYSSLMKSFQLLYKELKTTEASKLLTVNQVLKFTSADIFKLSLPRKKFLLNGLIDNIKLYPQEITKLLRLSLKMFADGFADQKGAIFGFGPQADDPCNETLKICTASKETMEKLDKFVDVHNIGGT